MQSLYSNGFEKIYDAMYQTFIDYDDESTISYLALIYGDMLGKRYKLEQRPEAI